MSDLDKIEQIKKISKSVESTETEEVGGKISGANNKEAFDTLMVQGENQKQAMTVEQVQATKKASLIDEIQALNNKVNQFKADPKSLIAQAQGVINQINDVKSKLATPNLQIKSSAQTVMKSRLSHIDENLKIALSKTGIEYNPGQTQPAGKVNPIDRFLGFLTDGQNQLENLSTEVQTMAANKKEFSPANMLLVQIKVGNIQQELEFFTNLLNKALESTKTIMNVQV